MTPEQFRDARIKLGLSQNEIAADMGIHDGRTVRRWEHGQRDIPGSVEIVLAYWLSDLETGHDRIVLTLTPANSEPV